MGTTASSSLAACLADALFPRTRQRVLRLLFGHPERSFYTKELIGLAGSGSGAVQRELGNLADSGLITVQTVGNQKHYQANARSPIYEELRSIVQKTVGLAEPLRAALEPLAQPHYPQPPGVLQTPRGKGGVSRQGARPTKDLDHGEHR